MDAGLVAFGRLVRACIAWPLAAAGLFALAAIMGGLIGSNPQWREADHGVTIMVETNGFHTGFIFPNHAAGVDWHRIFSPQDLADPRYHPKGATTHVAIGWGERDFYLNTPDWSQLNPIILIRASLGSDHTLMHVYHLRNPQPGRYAREITLSTRDYQRLSRLVVASLARPDRGRPQPISGYGIDDLFYRARGHYSLINSCNAWTGRQLRKIGVRVGIWTPTENDVMRWFPEPKAPPQP